MKLMLYESALHLRRLSRKCCFPEEAYARMLDSMKAAETYIYKVVIRNMFNKLVQLKIGTGEVESVARRVLGSDTDCGRLKKEVVRILKIRREQVEREMKELKREWISRTSEVREYIVDDRVRRRYIQIERRHRDMAYKSKLNLSKKKVHGLKTKKDRKAKQQTREEHKWYRVTDEELGEIEPIDVGDNYEVYGDIHLSEPEKKCLALGPKFMMTPKLSKEEFEVEAEMECVKQRMELWKRSQEADDEGNVDERDLEEAESNYREKKEIYRKDKGILNMRKLTVTDAKYNTRSDPIRAAAKKEEIKIQAKRQEMMDAFSRTTGAVCDKKGYQKKENISKVEKEGLRKLKQRRNDGEIVITTTDKSGKLAVVETELYKSAVQVHLKDPCITPDEMREKETLLNRHALQIVKALKMGTYHGGTEEKQEDRMNGAFMSVGGRPGPLYVLVKDHKATEEGSQMPPTRPVCNAKGGPGARLSNLLSIILNRATDSMGAKTECMSTEEALSGLLDCNRRIKAGALGDKAKDAIIMSMDVKSLYPSMKKEEVCPVISRTLEKLMYEGTFQIEEVDIHEVGKFLYITKSKAQLEELGIMEAMPERSVGRNAPGRKPGPAYWESDYVTDSQKKRDRDNEGEAAKKDKWVRGREPSKRQECRMVAHMIGDAVWVAMSNHMYRFDGQYYHQSNGGPIGDELAQAVARLYMVWWDGEFLDRCLSLHIEIPFYMRYVDDTDQLTIPQPPGTRYRGGRLEIDPELRAIDATRPADIVTAELVQQVANSVSRIIEVTVDVCSNHEDRKMPVLDTKQWVGELSGFPQVLHEFYKKPMASKLALRANTAYSEGQLKATLIQEILRRLRNCSPEISWEDKGKHLTEFALSLQASGYSEETRRKVFDIAVRRYVGEWEKHMRGEKDMYRSREVREEQQESAGGKTDKSNWYKKKGNGKVTSVMAVPYTGGVLAEEVKERIARCRPIEGIKTKIIEGGGEKLVRSLMCADPFPRSTCYRQDCPVIRKGKEGCGETCFQQNATYIARCVLCTEDRERARAEGEPLKEEWRYVGESSRGLYVRHKGHRAEYTAKLKGDEKRAGFMHRHAEEQHGGKRDLRFSMERTSAGSCPMRRVIRESVQIVNTRELRGVKMMNASDEYFGVRVVTPSFTQE